MDVTNLTDEQLAAEAARERSDGPAFVAIVDRFRQRVWTICYRLMGNEHDAHDAAQEVFVRLFLQREKFEGRSKYSTWVHGIALRTCLSLRRGRGRRKRRETLVPDTILQQQPARKEATTGISLEVMQLLESLSEEDRAMLILKYAENYSYEDLAAMSDRSVSSCKMRISRAREKLQKQHSNEDNEPM